MKAKKVPDNVLGYIDLRLSEAQYRMMKLENQKILTVPIYDDIENDPPSVAIEGQVALSQADLKVWWFSNQAWHTCENCYDDIDIPTVLGGDLNECTTTSNLWSQLDGDGAGGPAHLIDMCLHQNELWVVHVDLLGSQHICGIYVKHWNGTMWVDMGFPPITPADGSTNFPNRPAIASDNAGNVFVAFCTRRKEDIICPISSEHPNYADNRIPYVNYQRYIHVWKWNGSVWTKQAEFLRPYPVNIDPLHCSVFSTNHEFNIGTLGDTSGGGFSPYIKLGARNGNYAVVWWEKGMDANYCTQTYDLVNVQTQQCGFCPSSGIQTGPGQRIHYDVLYCGYGDGVNWTLNTINERLFDVCTSTLVYGNFHSTEFDMVWDDDAGPMLLTAFFDHTDELKIIDPRDGTEYNSYQETNLQAYGGLKVLSKKVPNPIAGGTGTKRYIGTVKSSGSNSGRIVLETNGDCSAPIGPLDEEITYRVSNLGNQNFAAFAPEKRNVWVIGRGPIGIFQFDRLCPMNVPPKRWRLPNNGLGQRVPPLGPTSSPPILGWPKMILLHDKLYVSTTYVPSGGNGHQQVYEIPIMRCVHTCEGAPTCIQFPATDQTVARGTVINWSHSVNSLLYDYCEFFIDDTLVYTDTSATIAGSQNRFYYGGSSPGAYNTSGLSIGAHYFRSVSHSTKWGRQCQQSHIVTLF